MQPPRHTSETSINLSTRAVVSLVLFVLTSAAFLMTAVRWAALTNEDGPGRTAVTVVMVAIAVVLGVAVVFFQGFFTRAPDEHAVSAPAADTTKRTYVFRNQSGFACPQRYVYPWLGYLSFLFMTVLVFIEPVFVTPRSGKLFFQLLTWWPFVVLGGFLPARYLVLASYLEIHAGMIVLRRGLTTHYVPAESIEHITYITRDSQLHTLVLALDGGRTVSLKLNYLAPHATAIQEAISGMYEGEERTSVLKRIPKSQSIPRDRTISGGFGRATRW